MERESQWLATGMSYFIGVCQSYIFLTSVSCTDSHQFTIIKDIICYLVRWTEAKKEQLISNNSSSFVQIKTDKKKIFGENWAEDSQRLDSQEPYLQATNQPYSENRDPCTIQQKLWCWLSETVRIEFIVARDLIQFI